MMGTCADFSARLSVKFSLKRETGENTIKEIADTISDNPETIITNNVHCTRDTIVNHYEAGEVFELEANDEMLCTTNNTIQELLAFYEDYEESDYTLTIIEEVPTDTLKILNLPLIREFSITRIPSNLIYYVTVTTLYGNVYNETDNEIQETVNYKKLQDYMKYPSAILTLFGDGDCSW